MSTRDSRKGHRPGGDLRNAVEWPTSSFDQPLDTPPPIPRETYSVDFFVPPAPYPSVPSTSAPTPGATRPSTAAPSPLPGTGLVDLRLSPATAVAVLDGAPIAFSAGTLTLAEGPHRVRVSAPGYLPREVVVDVRAGFVADVPVKLEVDPTSPSPTSAPGEASPDSESPREIRVWPWAMGLLGVVALVGGGVVLVARRRARATPSTRARVERPSVVDPA